MRKLYLSGTFIFLLSFINTYAQVSILNTEIETDTIITGLNVPWEIQWGPDDHIWMTERSGIISRVNPENGQRTVILDHRDQVYQEGEAGMLGMVLHPDFQDTAHLFVAYTYLDDNTVKEKLVRYLYNDNDLTNPYVLIDNIPGNSTHNGSRLIILPDYTILMTTGDAQNQASSQDTSSLNGKILRLNLNGDIPADNPFPGSPVWTYGHRNAQGLVFSPNGRIYSSEHGPTTDDEINIIEKGANYGWPEVHGYCDNPSESNFCNANSPTSPIQSWTPTIAPSDIIWYDSDAIPEFQNSILLAVLKEKMIVKIALEEDGTIVDETYTYFKNNWGRLRDILQGPHGEIYIATNGESWSNTDPGTHSILRIKAKNTTNTALLQQRNNHLVYPNPASNNITLVNKYQMNSDVLIQIHNIEGKAVYHGKFPGSHEEYTISVKHLKPGFYTIRFIAGNEVMLNRFLVQ